MADGLVVRNATRKSPERGVGDEEVGIELEPRLTVLPSTPEMSATSAATMCPSAAPARSAVIVVGPDEPAELMPTQTSAVPFEAWIIPATRCHVTPPPVSCVASYPGPVEPLASVPIIATTASPAVTPFGSVACATD